MNFFAEDADCSLSMRITRLRLFLKTRSNVFCVELYKNFKKDRTSSRDKN
jgi:hypothetical protein